jgi:hypothetical protein
MGHIIQAQFCHWANEQIDIYHDVSRVVAIPCCDHENEQLNKIRLANHMN